MTETRTDDFLPRRRCFVVHDIPSKEASAKGCHRRCSKKIFQRRQRIHHYYPIVLILLCIIFCLDLIDEVASFQTTNFCRFQERRFRFGLHHQRLHPIILFRTNPKNNLDMEIQRMEKEVIATTNAKLDMKRIVNALEEKDTSSSIISNQREQQDNNNPEYIANSAPVWKLAFAGAITASIITYVITDANVFLSGIVLVSLFVVGIGDPIEQDNDGIWGSIARLLGRQTIQSVEKSKPKIRAVVKAAISSSSPEEETSSEQHRIRILEQQIRDLEEENTRLALWQRRRLKIDDCLSDYTLSELKDIARKNNIKIGGTKSQLMMRLVENDLIDSFDMQ